MLAVRRTSMETRHKSHLCGSTVGCGHPRSTSFQIWNSLLISLAVLALAGIAGCAKKEAPARPEPPEVVVARVLQPDVPIYAEYVSQLNGAVNAEITPKVQGYLLQQNYANGFFVKKGQLLFTLDPRQ